MMQKSGYHLQFEISCLLFAATPYHSTKKAASNTETASFDLIKAYSLINR